MNGCASYHRTESDGVVFIYINGKIIYVNYSNLFTGLQLSSASILEVTMMH